MQHDYSELRILLVEDDASFASLLELLLRELGIEHITKCSSYETGWQAFVKQQPNLCILDIELGAPLQNGISLAKRIREEANDAVAIIFITAYFLEAYYAQAREANPCLFMAKDFSKLKLLQALDIASAHLSQTRRTGGASDKAAQGTQQPALILNKQSNFFFKVGNVFRPFDIEKIAYFYADSKMTYARIEKRNFPTSVQLKVLEEELFPTYLRCHKKYLINTKKIDSILIREDRVMMGEDALPIGYHYRKTFLDNLRVLK